MNDSPPAVVSPPEVPAPQTLVCANCDAPLTGEYCADCGQRHEPHVHSVSHFAAEALESITHADSRLWRTLWFLLAKPGRLTREFFEGHRVSYLPPFRLYLVISLGFFLLAGLPEGATLEIDSEDSAERIANMNEVASSLEGEFKDVPGAAQAASAIRAEAAREIASPKADSAAGEDDNSISRGLKENNALTEFCKGFAEPDPKAGRNYARLYTFCNRAVEDRGSALFEAIWHNIPRAMFVFLPLLALCMKPLYWRPKRYYVEHLLLLVHNHAFVFLVLALVALLELIPVVGEHLGILEFAVWLYITWYIFRALRVYYGQSRKLTFGKFLVIGLAYLSTTALTFVLLAIFSALTLEDPRG